MASYGEYARHDGPQGNENKQGWGGAAGRQRRFTGNNSLKVLVHRVETPKEFQTLAP
jgi:hypothetical protein